LQKSQDADLPASFELLLANKSGGMSNRFNQAGAATR